MKLLQAERQTGFTLIEALIALLVLSLGLFGLMQTQTRVMTETGDSKTRTVAVNLAQEKLEELRASDYADIAGGKDLIPAAAGGTSNFARTWTATPSSEPPYYEVSVTTRWTRPGDDSENADSSVTLTTFIAQSAAVALGTIGGPSKGNLDDPPGEDDSGDGDAPGGQDDSGDDDWNSDDAGGDDDSGEDEDVPGPGSCSCFYGQNKNDISLVASNGSCCSKDYCEKKAPDGIKKNTSFVAICPL